jgi:WhiB family redox-sensing transcriptional regulator
VSAETLELAPPARWVHLSVCTPADAAAFFPGLDGAARAAKAICGTCPVRIQCGNYALRAESGFGLYARAGVWGGMTARERYAIDQAANRKASHLKKAS